jgi:hypothetical protein
MVVRTGFHPPINLEPTFPCRKANKNSLAHHTQPLLSTSAACTPNGKCKTQSQAKKRTIPGVNSESSFRLRLIVLKSRGSGTVIQTPHNMRISTYNESAWPIIAVEIVTAVVCKEVA